MPILRRVGYPLHRPGTISYRLPHLQLQNPPPSASTVYSMGSVWSSYAGSTDIAAFASPENAEEVKEYDYIVCGGQSCDQDTRRTDFARGDSWLCDCQPSEGSLDCTGEEADEISSPKTQTFPSW
jgi:hypothetical protein